MPGWLVAGARALDARASAPRSATLGSRRTYMQDVHATLVDLLGAEDARAALPLADARRRPLAAATALGAEPTALLATSTAVWEPDDARFGAMQGARALIGSPGSWQCFDTARDPTEEQPRAERDCADLLGLVRQRFPDAR